MGERWGMAWGRGMGGSEEGKTVSERKLGEVYGRSRWDSWRQRLSWEMGVG